MNDTPLSMLIQSDVISDLGARDTITQIKSAAIRQFQALDARMRVISTEYFNHSFTPDLVLRWPRGGEKDRYVYMRSSAQNEVLAEDVERLGELRPILLDLVPIHGKLRRQGTENLNALAHENDTLVTDPIALASIGEAKRQRPVASLFTAALTQGGRGLLDDNNAQEAEQVIVDGFNGARQIEAASVSRATATAEDRLSAPVAERFNRLLQATWIASGGHAELFPYSRLGVAEGIDEDYLEYLLELDPISDLDFWRSLGATVSISQIGDLSLEHPNANLQFLIKANLDRFTARSCRIQDRPQQLDELDYPNFWWLAERGTLALRSRDWIAYFAEKADELNNIKGTQTSGVPVPDLIERARGRVLTGIEVSDGDFELDLRSSGSNVTDSNHLDALTSSFGALARVQHARALAGSRQIACDFSKSSASTASMITLAEFLGLSLPLLRRMSEQARAELEELLRIVDSSASAPSQGTSIQDSEFLLDLSEDEIKKLRGK